MGDEPIGANEIMDGVYRALCTHGYAELTMQDIADECDRSTSVLHYHYDTKEELLVSFLERLIADYEARLAAEADRPPLERLVAFIARFVYAPADETRASFHVAMLEMRSQGPFNERIREQLADSDRVHRETLADILESGIEAGVFVEMDTERVATLIVATLDGARTRQITVDEAPTADAAYTRTVAEEIIDRVIEPLVRDDVDVPSLLEMLSEVEIGTLGEDE